MDGRFQSARRSYERSHHGAVSRAITHHGSHWSTYRRGCIRADERQRPVEAPIRSYVLIELRCHVFAESVCHCDVRSAVCVSFGVCAWLCRSARVSGCLTDEVLSRAAPRTWLICWSRSAAAALIWATSRTGELVADFSRPQGSLHNRRCGRLTRGILAPYSEFRSAGANSNQNPQLSVSDERQRV